MRDEPEWVIEQYRARKRRELLRQREDMEARLARVRAKEKSQRDKYLKDSHKHKRRKPDGGDAGGSDDDEDFVLDEYESDRGHSQSGQGAGTGLSAKTLEMMTRLGMVPKANEEDEEIEEEMKVSQV